MEESTMTRAILFSAVLVGLFSTPAMAQRSSRNQVIPSFDIDFPGGTLDELLKVIEGKIGTKTNVIASKDALAAVLPAFSLRQVNTKDVLQAMEKLVVLKDKKMHIASSGPVITVHLRGYPTRTVPKWTRVHDLRDLLGEGNYKVADIVTAVETAWGMGAKERTAQLKFHDETKLLIAMGTEFELDIIDRVLTELRRGGQIKAAEAARKKLADELALAKAQKEKSEAEHKLTREKLGDYQTAMVKYQKQTDSYERQIADLRERIKKLSAENQALERKIKVLEMDREAKKGR
jgi:cell division protein FtsB